MLDNVCAICGLKVPSFANYCIACQQLIVAGQQFNLADPIIKVGPYKQDSAEKKKKEEATPMPTGTCHCEVTAFGMIYKEGCPECPNPKSEK